MVSSDINTRRAHTLTLELDVAVHKPYAVHPCDRSAQLAPYPPHKGFLQPGVTGWVIDQV